MTVGKFILVVVFRDDEPPDRAPLDSSCYNAATTALSSTTLTTIAGNGNSGPPPINSIKLLAAYRENIHHVLDLQATLIRDIFFCR